MVPRLGPWEISLILVIILMVFGAGKLPQVGEAIGRGLRAFRKGRSEKRGERELHEPKKRVAEKTAAGRTKRAKS